MGLDDRDYMRNRGKENVHNYDPKEFRGTAASQKYTKKRSGSGWLVSAVIWISAGLIIFLVFQQHKENKVGYQQTHLSSLPNNCESLPPNGSSILIDPSVIRRSDVLYSGVQIDNLLANPVVLVISNPERAVRYEAVAIYPRQTAKISLPIAEYGLTVLTGTSWCNINNGFTNGVNANVDGAMPLRSGETTTVSLHSTGNRLGDIRVNYTVAPVAPPPAPPSQVEGNGYMDLRLAKNGHYMVTGTVNGTPVEFMLDTGAGLTSITEQTARQAGITTTCVQRLFNTANGQANGCVATVPVLTFGNFRIVNSEVAIMPNMTNELLGMNVLGRVRLEQQGNVMRVSAQ